MKVYDYECDCGEKRMNYLANTEYDNVRCSVCNLLMKRLHPAGHQLTTITPTYPGSKAHKAGYVHQFKNRPAEKTQIGYGGSVSADHPTGGGSPGNL